MPKLLINDLFCRYDPSINKESPYIELFPSKMPLRNPPITISENKKCINKALRNKYPEEENCYSEEDTDMFSTQSSSTPKQSLIISKAQTPMTDREKELDDQFEVCLNIYVTCYCNTMLLITPA